MSAITRRLPVGAELQADGSTSFRVWAPAPREVTLVVYGAGEPRDIRMTREADGHYSAEVPGAGAGTRYRYRLDGRLFADPASRFQPDGVFGPSEVIDPASFRWTDADWRGLTLPGQVFYEMHVGTFTNAGTWRAAVGRLPSLAETGITVVEVMPIAEFPGRFGWGYDGVFPYAPTRLYGAPDDFRAFVDRAHALGIAVVLDVVYNHLGPEGSVFREYAPGYFSERYKGEWGDPLNFDGPDAGPVRAFFAHNGAYWVREFHVDGLRLDATHGIFDASDEHILARIGREARAAAARRPIVLVAENEPQDTRLVRPLAQGGYGLDALWNDDCHHSMFVAATGRREAYYSDHRGTPQELLSCAKYGLLFQGQRYSWQRQPRGRSTRAVPPMAFITYTENHDQLANSGDGSRLRFNTAPGVYRALTTLHLLMPGTPMLFQGQEFGTPAPFLYFADLSAELAEAVRRGRAEFVRQFPSLATPEMQARLAPPHEPATFERCRLDWDAKDACITRLVRDLLALRRSDAAFRMQAEGRLDGSILGQALLLLRFFTPSPADERLLLVNLGADYVAPSIADALVAPPDGFAWRLAWSSEAPEYGGLGTPAVLHDEGWHITGHAGMVLEAAHDGHRSN